MFLCALATMKTPDVLLFCVVVFLSVIVSTTGKYEGETDILAQNNLSKRTTFGRKTSPFPNNKSVYGQKKITFQLCANFITSLQKKESENSITPIRIHAGYGQTRFN
jgi:hypothetical protein